MSGLVDVLALRGSLLFLLTALLCGISLLLAEHGWTWVAVSYARSVVNLLRDLRGRCGDLCRTHRK